MGQDIHESPLAIYIHVPFCLTKCGYCSFYSCKYDRTATTDYLDALEAEVKLYLEAYPELAKADTIYFGGGSPSILSSPQISTICSYFSYSEDAEITLEINPIQITPAFLQALMASPINRLSIGLQSTLDKELIWLERRHRARDIESKLALLTDYGYENWSLDLIYGLPGSQVDDLKANLEAFISYRPKHISSYLLSLDDSCAWAATNPEKYQAVLALDEGYQSDSYELIRSTLARASYQQYEISNFCLPGYQSRHNLHYWHSEDYLGLGPSASGFIKGKRYQNQADLQAWKSDIRQGKLMPNPDLQARSEDDYLMMGLRLSEGIKREDARLKLGCDIWTSKAEAIRKLSSYGLLKVDSESLSLDPKAYFISNAVIGELMR